LVLKEYHKVEIPCCIIPLIFSDHIIGDKDEDELGARAGVHSFKITLLIVARKRGWMKSELGNPRTTDHN